MKRERYSEQQSEIVFFEGCLLSQLNHRSSTPCAASPITKKKANIQGGFKQPLGVQPMGQSWPVLKALPAGRLQSKNQFALPSTFK